METRLVPKVGKDVGVALETNGKGYVGFLVELPGAYVRGRTREEALSKVDAEVRSYLRWLGAKHTRAGPVARVVQEHRCTLMVDDADSEILLDADKGRMGKKEFTWMRALALHSGETFAKVFEGAKLKDWVDESRVRSTFYGPNPKTIREISDHVNGTQWYYLSRTRTRFVKNQKLSFLEIRQYCLGRIDALYGKNNNFNVYDVDNELWTLKKLLRRFVWHDRIHSKAILRMQRKQKELGMIDGYQDPFCFGEG
jgi:hypothetical protein